MQVCGVRNQKANIKRQKAKVGFGSKAIAEILTLSSALLPFDICLLPFDFVSSDLVKEHFLAN